MDGRNLRHNKRRGSRAGAFLTLAQEGSAADGDHFKVLGFDVRRPIGDLIVIRPQALQIVAQLGLVALTQRRERAFEGNVGTFHTRIDEAASFCTGS